MVFPEFYQQCDIAYAVPAAVVSAGRVSLDGGRIAVTGMSTPLGVSSREEDSEIIQSYFDGQNVIQQER